MATSAMASSGWKRAKVKAVPSGDTLLIMAIVTGDAVPPEKSLILSCIIAPRLARRYGTDEPFAWESREFLRRLCIGKDILFKVDSTTSGREYGTVYLGDTNIAYLLVAHGFAKVKAQGRLKGGNSPYTTELLRLEEKAKDQGLGCWSKEQGIIEASTRILPSSTNPFEVKSFFAQMKGKALEAIVEQVRDGSTIRVHLFPSFHFVQVYIAGIQAPSMGRRAFIPSMSSQAGATGDDDVNGRTAAQVPMAATQKLVPTASTYSEIPPERFGREAKHFTETRVLNREVRIILKGTDSFDNMFASVYYCDGNTDKDLALELIENGFAKYMEWSANMLGDETKKKLKNAEIQAKKEQQRIWTGFQPPATNTRPNQKFTGKVIEVVNGYCVIVADDVASCGSPLAERRVNLSSIRAPKLVHPSGGSETIEHFARAAKEFLRTRLIGKQVHVSMEYSRRINIANGQVVTEKTNQVDTRVLDYGSVFLPSMVDGTGSPSPNSSGNPLGVNVAVILLSRGLADITRHRDYEERSHHYDDLLVAYSRAENAKKGYHSKKDYPVNHMNDLTTVPAKKAREFFHLLQKNKRHSAVVDYIFSGHRFKLTMPHETSTIVFSFSCVRCPAKNEPYSDDAISLMRRRILQRDVEIEIEAVDKSGTFLGSLWESKTNMASVLLQAGLARLNSFGLDRNPYAQNLIEAEKTAKQHKMKVWENYNEQEVIPQGSMTKQNGKETFKVIVTEVLGGGKFYAQIVGDHRVDNIQQQLASLKSPTTKKNEKEANEISETSKETSKDTSDTLGNQDQTINTQSDAFEVKVKPHNQVVPLPVRWSSLFKDQLNTTKGEVKFSEESNTSKVNDLAIEIPFTPTKGDMVLAQFSRDNSWNRAMIVNEHQGPIEREFEVFYIDKGNQENVTCSHLRPAPANFSISVIPPLAKLCSLAFVVVPDIMDDLGEKAAGYLRMFLLNNELKATVEERGSVGAKLEGQGTGEVLIVSMYDEGAEINISAAMLENGLAQLDKKRWNSSWERRATIKNLEGSHEYAKKQHRGIWQLQTLVGAPDKSVEGKTLNINDDEDLLAQARPSKGYDLIKLIESKSTRPPET